MNRREIFSSLLAVLAAPFCRQTGMSRVEALKTLGPPISIPDHTGMPVAIVDAFRENYLRGAMTIKEVKELEKRS